MRQLLATASIVILLSACVNVNVRQPIQDYRLFDQPLSQLVTASVGSTLVRMNRQGDLPNVYGGKDIYGGKVDRGYVEVKLVGISGKEITLSVSDVARQSSETTMDRYVTRPLVDVKQTVNLASSSQEGMLVRIDTANEKEYVIGGVKISFLETRTSSIIYRVDDLMPVQSK